MAATAPCSASRLKNASSPPAPSSPSMAVALRPLTMLITFGWAALAAMFSFSIAMVVWGRNGDNTLGY